MCPLARRLLSSVTLGHTVGQVQPVVLCPFATAGGCHCLQETGRQLDSQLCGSLSETTRRAAPSLLLRIILVLSRWLDRLKQEETGLASQLF